MNNYQCTTHMANACGLTPRRLRKEGFEYRNYIVPFWSPTFSRTVLMAKIKKAVDNLKTTAIRFAITVNAANINTKALGKALKEHAAPLVEIDDNGLITELRDATNTEVANTFRIPAKTHPVAIGEHDVEFDQMPPNVVRCAMKYYFTGEYEKSKSLKGGGDDVKC